jgi:hypothetical protein
VAAPITAGLLGLLNAVDVSVTGFDRIGLCALKLAIITAVGLKSGFNRVAYAKVDNVVKTLPNNLLRVVFATLSALSAFLNSPHFVSLSG